MAQALFAFLAKVVLSSECPAGPNGYLLEGQAPRLPTEGPPLDVL